MARSSAAGRSVPRRGRPRAHRRTHRRLRWCRPPGPRGTGTAGRSRSSQVAPSSPRVTSIDTGTPAGSPNRAVDQRVERGHPARLLRVDHQRVGAGHDIGRQRGRGSQVEDDPGAGGVRPMHRLGHDRAGQLALHQQHVTGPESADRCQVGRLDRRVGAEVDHDGVVPVGVDHDVRRAGRDPRRRPQMLDVDAEAGQPLAVGRAHGVVADPADHRHPRRRRGPPPPPGWPPCRRTRAASGRPARSRPARAAAPPAG